MSNLRLLCQKYGSNECPLRGTDGTIYDMCPLCEPEFYLQKPNSEK
ncbi:MAG: hypothetical protein L6N95_01870 [Candidatus Methylarchaceae archaeon HK01B]|nr:hypothetical protein [Candidatus Methylarchaceae archaeon HK02M1]MCP8318560.1 hypothetical protein [Candidatus Methylarchaceae archaeon HK01B]